MYHALSSQRVHNRQCAFQAIRCLEAFEGKCIPLVSQWVEPEPHVKGHRSLGFDGEMSREAWDRLNAV